MDETWLEACQAHQPYQGCCGGGHKDCTFLFLMRLAAELLLRGVWFALLITSE